MRILPTNADAATGHGHGTRYSVRPLLAAGLVAAVAGLAGHTDSQAAAEDWRQRLPGFDSMRHDPEILSEQRRSEREQIRTELNSRMGAELQSTAPLLSQQTVAALRAAIDRYQTIVVRGGWPAVPEGGTLRRGDSGERVSLLRRRLAITGDLQTGGGAEWQFDPPLEEAVARFQARHGVRITGFVDKRTLRALNVSAVERLRQLQINMARLADLQEIAKAERYVIVNVPAYELQAVERDGLIISSAVVVGKPERETPVVSAKIVEVNFYPFWRVPDSIATKDLVPQLRKDPSYIAREHFSVLKTWGTEPLNASIIDWQSPEAVNYKFRQDPGPWNALGVVRINMPNVHTVYLHDTPLKQLFGQASRAFSSGCVRVQRVFDLVAWLLKDEAEWSSDRVHATVNEGMSLDVKLKKAVPVHFVYVTAWARSDGLPIFRPDIYGKDGAAEAAADDDETPADRSITP